MKNNFTRFIFLTSVFALIVFVGDESKADLRDLYDQTNCTWNNSQWKSADDETLRYCRRGRDIYETYEDYAERIGSLRKILKSKIDKGRNTEIAESQLEVEGGKLVRYSCTYKLGLSCESPTREVIGVPNN